MTPAPYVPGAHEIELASGAYLDLLDPDPAVITLEVIALGLSNTCRYGGQTARFYSVAEHACLVAAKLAADGYPSAYQLAGLHHDDAEAFIADVARPLKTLLQPTYGEVSDRLDRAVSVALDLPLPAPGSAMLEAVRAADDWALAAEAYHLMPSRGRGWHSDGLYDPGDALVPYLDMGPGEACEVFLDYHRGLVALRSSC